MPSTFCLLPKHADEFLEKVKSGEWSAESLSKMTSDERHAAFAEVFGPENARQVNASFESKLLLKNQQEGVRRWIESAGKLKPEIKRDLLSRVERMDRVLQPTEMNDFLADLAHQKLGFGVTSEEAGKISELAKDVSDARTANDFPAYLDARAKFREYVGPLQQPPLTKAQGLAAYVRAGALSWPTTLVKLTSVAASRMVTTPITDAVAAGVSKILPELAEGAPRYGAAASSVMVKAEAAAQAAAWTDGLIDAGRLLMNKSSRLDLAHGNDNAVAHRWFEYFGSIHGALKEPVKRAEYTRSLFRRTADAIARGENTNDLGAKVRLSTEAYKDALGSVSMNDNRISTQWNKTLRGLEAPDKVTGKVSPAGTLLSTAMQVEMPVSKAPTNVVIEASEYIHGLLTGGSKAAWGYAHGLEGLQPLERDAIIRQISRGSVGAAIMALYYFKHDQVEFGGFYQHGEKRGPNDVPAGGMRVGGVTVPKMFLHNPMIYAAQYAASVRRTMEHHPGHDDHGLASASLAAFIGLIDEVPIIGGVTRDVQAVMDPATRDEFMAKKVSSASVPGLVQWIAQKADPAPKRYPKGLTQHLEANVPGLRERVPTTKRKR